MNFFFPMCKTGNFWDILVFRQFFWPLYKHLICCLFPFKKYPHIILSKFARLFWSIINCQINVSAIDMMNYNGPFNGRYGLSHQGWEIEFFSWWIIASIDHSFCSATKQKVLSMLEKLLLLLLLNEITQLIWKQHNNHNN